VESRVRHAKTAVSYIVGTNSAVSLAVVHVTTVVCLVVGPAFITSVICNAISRAPDLLVIVRVTTFCLVNIDVLDSVENRVSRSVLSAIARFNILIIYILALSSCKL